jgi:basic membrane lipoprotein Med (substrate-binding protein (PBP1-ABC) superfamily)/ABC-type phosphate/phosphonate transport system substrate-binding protein
MHDLIGQTLGQYRIIEQLGKGGMATVFKAFQPSLERYVALKVLPPYFAHEEGFSERFVREARAIARLDHPHILPIYDFGQDRDISYIAMKYVDAGTLKDLESDGPISIELALAVISQTAEALDYAHGQGIIHRDIKPANILMDRGQWVLLSDFGLAKMIEGSQQLTASGVGVGTPAYMAPEQGQGRKVDGRADIYSLGIVLYEMLTGSVPYEAETPLAVVLKHVTEPLKMPRLVNPSIPESVELVILKALAKEADDRYQTVGEMSTAFKNAVEDAPFLGVTDTAWPTSPEFAPGEPVVTVKAPIETVEPAPAPPGTVALPEVAAEAEPESAQMPTEVLAGAEPRATVAEVPVSEPVPVAPTKRRIPWWGFAIAGVLLVAVIVVGVGFATGWFGGAAYPDDAVVSELPTKTPIPTEEPGGPPPGSPPGQEVLLGLLHRPNWDVGGGAEALERYLSDEMEAPAQVIIFDDPMMLPQMLRSGEINAVTLSACEFMWLTTDEGLPLRPILTVPPVFYAELYVRGDGSVEDVDDLRGRPIALPSWDAWAGILGLGALRDEGLHAWDENPIIYAAPSFDLEMRTEPLHLLVRGEADAAIVGSDILGLAEEEMPGIGDKLEYLGESESMAWGLVAVMPELSEDQAWALHDALADVDPELVAALSPYGEVSSFDESLLESFARALSATGIQPWNLVEGVPPEKGPPLKPPPEQPPGAEDRPPKPRELRVAVVPAPGMQIDGNRLLTPLVRAIERTGEEYGFEVAIVGLPEDASPGEVANHHIDKGFNVIVAVAWPRPEEVLELAAGRPEATFVAFGMPPHDPLPNLSAFTYRMGEAGFLAGALAGKATENGVVGIVVGPRTNHVEQLLAGFERGVGHACPDCRIIVHDADTFGNIEAGYEIGGALVAEGADVVFNAAGGTGSAALRAAAEAGVWAIGVDWDEFETTFEGGRAPGADRLLGSVVIRADKHAHKTLAGLAEGRFEPGMHALGIVDEGVEFIRSPELAHPRQEELDQYVKGLFRAVREGEIGP